MKDEMVRTAVILYWIEADLSSDLVDDILEAYNGVSHEFIPPDDHSKLSEKLGTLAAADDALLATVLERGFRSWHSRLDLALASAAAERDRLCREATPLTFSSPELS